MPAGVSTLGPGCWLTLVRLGCNFRSLDRLLVDALERRAESMKRRAFMGLTAAATVAPLMVPTRAWAVHPDVTAARPRKVGKVEIVYKSPHAKPNGLQATKEGL